MGGQTSAAEGRTVEEIKEEFTKQTSTSLHKVITMEDKPSEVTEEYWQFVIDSILSNQDSIPATVMDSDHL